VGTLAGQVLARDSTREQNMVRSILFVVRGDENFPSSRFRAYQYREPLERLGVRVSFLRGVRSLSPLANLPFVRQLVEQVPKHDAVVYQKMLHPLQIALAARLNPNVFYDFDDAIHLTSTPGQFALTMRAAPKVIAGNRELAQVAARYGRQAEIVPTTVLMPTEVSAVARTPELELSWIGSACNLPFLNPARAAMQELRGRGLKLRLHVVTEQPEQVPTEEGISAERWSMETEDRALRACHVGLMPLVDDAWSRGKCACKALQYLSYARPVISSPVGMNGELFQHQPYARLARTVDDWASAISDLYERRDELDALGRIGRAMVDENFSVDAWAPRLAALLTPGRGNA
jgi:hypothetical protein